MNAEEPKLLLEKAKVLLKNAMKASGQGSYDRRLPTKESLALFTESHQILEHLISLQPRNTEALLLMSQCLECMMCFAESGRYLQEALNAGEPKSKKLLKKQALLKESERWWQTFPLTPSELDNLGNFLVSKHVDWWSTTTDYAEQWLKGHGRDNYEDILMSLAERGGTTDFLILSNIIQR